MKKLLVLIILDGYGISEEINGNAIKLAKTPNLDNIFSSNSFTLLKASGESVGLPAGQMGNSEVGHLNIGAGRIIYQDLMKINNSIKDKSFFKNPAFIQSIENCIKNNKALHLISLISDGGVHSHIEHLYNLLKLIKNYNFKKVYIHAVLDGRDTAPKSGLNFIKNLQEKIKEFKTGKIASISGRYYTMDRDKNWERIELAYNSMTGKSNKKFKDIFKYIEKNYSLNITDEFIKPAACEDFQGIDYNDSVIFLNFRPDRAREITESFININFNKFKRDFLNLNFTCMTEYNKDFKNIYIAFKKEKVKNTLSEYISRNNLNQVKIAETEKYAHVTFFLNGGIEKEYKNEKRILVNSPKVSTYDLKPEMSANEITEEVLKEINLKENDLIIINFANCDMVGHTGNLTASIKAVEFLDVCIKKITDSIKKVNGVVIITADHGNAEKMLDKNNIFTAHTCNLVPFCVVNYPCKLKNTGKLADIAPTALKILNLNKPEEMTGISLII